MRRLRPTRLVGPLLALGPLVMACSSSDDDTASTGPPVSEVTLTVATGSSAVTPPDATDAAVTGPASTAPVPAAVSPTVVVDCADREGATVTLLPDIEVPAVLVDPIAAPGVEIAGETVGGQPVPGFTIPGQVIDAGCIIEYDAPGGCLGAVEISAAVIGPSTIPSTVIPGVTLPDGQIVDDVTMAAVTAPMVVAPGVRTEAVCQIEEGGEVPTVSRAGVVRQAVARNGAVRPGATRPERCVGDECFPALRIEAVRLDPVRLADVDIDPARLQRRELGGGVDVMESEGTTAYITPGDVLFDTDQAVVRPDADAALSEVATQLEAATGAAIRIEGHTDDRAGDASNLDLSTRRAQAVAEWLTTRAGIDPARITVVGLGETAPAYLNDTDQHRQLNRRVVITVDT